MLLVLRKYFGFAVMMLLLVSHASAQCRNEDSLSDDQVNKAIFTVYKKIDDKMIPRGTAFLVHQDGYLLTSWHVTKDNDEKFSENLFIGQHGETPFQVINVSPERFKHEVHDIVLVQIKSDDVVRWMARYGSTVPLPIVVERWEANPDYAIGTAHGVPTKAFVPDQADWYKKKNGGYFTTNKLVGGLSGGPVLSSTHSVIGVTKWSDPKDEYIPTADDLLYLPTVIDSMSMFDFEFVDFSNTKELLMEIPNNPSLTHLLNMIPGNENRLMQEHIDWLANSEVHLSQLDMYKLLVKIQNLGTDEYKRWLDDANDPYLRGLFSYELITRSTNACLQKTLHTVQGPLLAAYDTINGNSLVEYISNNTDFDQLNEYAQSASAIYHDLSENTDQRLASINFSRQMFLAAAIQLEANNPNALNLDTRTVNFEADSKRSELFNGLARTELALASFESTASSKAELVERAATSLAFAELYGGTAETYTLSAAIMFAADDFQSGANYMVRAARTIDQKKEYIGFNPEYDAKIDDTYAQLSLIWEQTVAVENSKFRTSFDAAVLRDARWSDGDQSTQEESLAFLAQLSKQAKPYRRNISNQISCADNFGTICLLAFSDGPSDRASILANSSEEYSKLLLSRGAIDDSRPAVQQMLWIKTDF